ncbi:cytochrome b [Solemya pervernicosa gill symbiont]|uniref:Cytochrome b n=2 Tax=Gammaproteobacteria incertae sedis TaxID=118884 RepID=A0A1T2L2I0_9GAMM|nr:cytochrome b [Candidatus Reidiella endopervernicosa]OOZ39282.1 cytochrome b [Solemya pervernicosa gill symbiont]QKQ25540.1 cytochrome b [Candidatus Reidiella endopervernicosa]
MAWRNSFNDWGWLAIGFHWLTAVAVFGLFGLGLYMTGLTYYDPGYRSWPDLHRSIGVLLFVLIVARLIWRRIDRHPEPLASHAPWERVLAKRVHAVIYLLLFAVMVSGYLISTADGRGVEVFGLFTIPATISGIDKQEDIAGLIHLWLASILIGTALLHAAAALKHHFIDRDRTLRRMLGLGTKQQTGEER